MASVAASRRLLLHFAVQGMLLEERIVLLLLDPSRLLALFLVVMCGMAMNS
jgi:hypothetical protein